jgi:hypothetical protein
MALALYDYVRPITALIRTAVKDRINTDIQLALAERRYFAALQPKALALITFRWVLGKFRCSPWSFNGLISYSGINALGWAEKKKPRRSGVVEFRPGTPRGAYFRPRR